jgi:hypothetical protein
VVAAGSPQSGSKYILKPQVDQSGASHKPVEPGGKDRNGNDKDKEITPGKKKASLNPFYLPHFNTSTKVTIYWPDTFTGFSLYILDIVKKYYPITA